MGGFGKNFRPNKKKIEELKLDFFSEFIQFYETDIKFYTNPKDIKFEINQSKEFLQGEKGIYYFDMWRGYSSSLFNGIFDITKNTNQADLPVFFSNWIKCKGWNNVDLYEEITEVDIIWLKENIKIILEKLDKNDSDKDCFSHLHIFLEFVTENNWELRISNY